MIRGTIKGITELDFTYRKVVPTLGAGWYSRPEDTWRDYLNPKRVYPIRVKYEEYTDYEVEFVEKFPRLRVELYLAPNCYTVAKERELVYVWHVVLEAYAAVGEVELARQIVREYITQRG
jgi:hypothetical protein